MKKIDNITLGITCYNEENNITLCLENCLNFLSKNNVRNYEVLVTDNLSSDRTVMVVKKFISKKKNKKIKLIKNKTNILYSGSVNKIITLSKFNNIGIIDGDGEYDFHDFKKLFAKLNSGYDLVFGWRENRQDKIFRIFVTNVFNFLAKIIINSKINDLNCGIRVLKKPIFKKKFIEFKLNHANPEIYCKFLFKNKKISEVKVSHKIRKSGQSIHSFKNLIKTFFEVLSYFMRLRYKYIKN